MIYLYKNIQTNYIELYEELQNIIIDFNLCGDAIINYFYMNEIFINTCSKDIGLEFVENIYNYKYNENIKTIPYVDIYENYEEIFNKGTFLIDFYVNKLYIYF